MRLGRRCHGDFCFYFSQQEDSDGGGADVHHVSRLEAHVNKLSGWHDDLVQAEMDRMLRALSSTQLFSLPAVSQATPNDAAAAVAEGAAVDTADDVTIATMTAIVSEDVAIDTSVDASTVTTATAVVDEDAIADAVAMTVTTGGATAWPQAEEVPCASLAPDTHDASCGSLWDSIEVPSDSEDNAISTDLYDAVLLQADEAEEL